MNKYIVFGMPRTATTYMRYIIKNHNYKNFNYLCINEFFKDKIVVKEKLDNNIVCDDLTSKDSARRNYKDKELNLLFKLKTLKEYEKNNIFFTLQLCASNLEAFWINNNFKNIHDIADLYSKFKWIVMTTDDPFKSYISNWIQCATNWQFVQNFNNNQNKLLNLISEIDYNNIEYHNYWFTYQQIYKKVICIIKNPIFVSKEKLFDKNYINKTLPDIDFNINHKPEPFSINYKHYIPKNVYNALHENYVKYNCL